VETSEADFTVDHEAIENRKVWRYIANLTKPHYNSNVTSKVFVLQTSDKTPNGRINRLKAKVEKQESEIQVCTFFNNSFTISWQT
jgi:hypothetical protein